MYLRNRVAKGHSVPKSYDELTRLMQQDPGSVDTRTLKKAQGRMRSPRAMLGGR